jgi:parallel beta-helix repeat protein
MQIRHWSIISLAVMAAVLLPGMERSAAANTLCVNPKGSKGCYSTIDDAVNHAASSDTIQVAHGTYREMVMIGKSLSLIGAGPGHTIIDATGKCTVIGGYDYCNAIYIDGMDNPGLSEVVVQGFTVANAKFEGILVTNASNVTISGSQVTGNNTGLIPVAGHSTCPGQPAWEASEDFDCGEGIHLVAVDHSTVANNIVDHNAGGILLTDETGPTHDNMIIGNLVTENPYECGITLASHRSADGKPPYGVFHNTVAYNESTNNGLNLAGAGVGIGLSTSGGDANTQAYGNVVIGNRITGNGHPGVALHAHRAGANLTDNTIIGNYIAGNGSDSGDTPTAGPTGVNIHAGNSNVALTGNVVTGNFIEHESIDVAIKTPAQIDVHLNNLSGEAVGIANLGGGTINATMNWWGCSGGPQAAGCSGVQGTGIAFAPWLTKPVYLSNQDDEQRLPQLLDRLHRRVLAWGRGESPIRHPSTDRRSCCSAVTPGEAMALGDTMNTGGRTKTQLNDTWKFIASNTLTGAEAIDYDDSSWASVSVSHTWDTVTRVTLFTNSWYRTHFTIPPTSAGMSVYVYFEGVFQIADVYVNGQNLGQHRGGYTCFIFDATNAISFAGDNVLAVKVSNDTCSDCLPDGTPRLFKGYGGIYRKVWSITTSPYHVATTDYASSGVYITPSNVSSESANVSIRTLVQNDGIVDKTFTVDNLLTDRDEKLILALQQDIVVPSGSTVAVTQIGLVANPRLWSPSDPYLYNVHTNVSVDGAITDTVDEHTGFRYYQLTADDFMLNGSSFKLRGVSKHQETEYSASAVTDAELTIDWDNLQDLGVNYVRLVHYPHAGLEYTLADQRGFLVWAENGHTNEGLPTANGDNINREMVYQNYNHPSIIFWSAGNEASGVAATSQYAAVLRASDSTRPIVYGSAGEGTPSNVDFIFENVYPGWYYGSMYDWNTIGHPWISESGAGMVVGTQNADHFNSVFQVGSYEPEQYGAMVNEVKFQDMFVTNPSHVPAFSNFQFREISDVLYKNTINTKGILTFSTYKKDIYYLYQSFLKADPAVVRIVGPHYFLRDSNPSGCGDIKVYSNALNLTLTVNGINRGTQANGSYTHLNGLVINNVFYWTDVLQIGRNDIQAADDSGNADIATIYYKGTGEFMPNEAAAKVFNVASSNVPAFFINTPISDQRPFYRDFDGTGDNTFDTIPSELSGAVGWIATKRQSDSARTSDISFDLTADADVYIMFSRQSTTPSWITDAGFSDTGVSGRWRDDSITLVDYQLFKASFAAGSHVALASSPIDFVIIVR